MQLLLYMELPKRHNRCARGRRWRPHGQLSSLHLLGKGLVGKVGRVENDDKTGSGPAEMVPVRVHNPSRDEAPTKDDWELGSAQWLFSVSGSQVQSAGVQNWGNQKGGVLGAWLLAADWVPLCRVRTIGRHAPKHRDGPQAEPTLRDERRREVKPNSMVKNGINTQQNSFRLPRPSYITTEKPDWETVSACSRSKDTSISFRFSPNFQLSCFTVLCAAVLTTHSRRSQPPAPLLLALIPPPRHK